MLGTCFTPGRLIIRRQIDTGFALSRLIIAQGALREPILRPGLLCPLVVDTQYKCVRTDRCADGPLASSSRIEVRDLVANIVTARVIK